MRGGSELVTRNPGKVEPAVPGSPLNSTDSHPSRRAKRAFVEFDQPRADQAMSASQVSAADAFTCSRWVSIEGRSNPPPPYAARTAVPASSRRRARSWAASSDVVLFSSASLSTLETVSPIESTSSSTSAGS